MKVYTFNEELAEKNGLSAKPHHYIVAAIIAFIVVFGLCFLLAFVVDIILVAVIASVMGIAAILITSRFYNRRHMDSVTAYAKDDDGTVWQVIMNIQHGSYYSPDAFGTGASTVMNAAGAAETIGNYYGAQSTAADELAVIDMIEKTKSGVKLYNIWDGGVARVTSFSSVSLIENRAKMYVCSAVTTDGKTKKLKIGKVYPGIEEIIGNA